MNELLITLRRHIEQLDYMLDCRMKSGWTVDPLINIQSAINESILELLTVLATKEVQE